MRSFLAGLALLLAWIAGTAALTSYVALQGVLSPHGSGRVLSSALQQPALRHRILADVVPGYGELPDPLRREVNQVVQSPRFDQAIAHLRVDAHGRVDLTGLRQQLERRLRAQGLDQLATMLGSVGGPATVTLPSPVRHDYAKARAVAHRIAVDGAVAAGVLLLFALLVSPNRRRTVRGAGWTILASCAATAVLWWASPALAKLSSRRLWVDIATAAQHASTATVVATLVPVAVVGVVVLLVSLLVPGPRPRVGGWDA
jgi:hypothetical protein